MKSKKAQIIYLESLISAIKKNQIEITGFEVVQELAKKPPDNQYRNLVPTGGKKISIELIDVAVYQNYQNEIIVETERKQNDGLAN